jgi:hypothetical protein
VATNTQSIGIAFTETMKGYVSKGWNPPDDHADADRAGQAADSRMDFTLTITMPDLDAFLVSDEHAGIAKGVVHVNGFTDAGGAPVEAKVFNLFVSGGAADRRKMLYSLPSIVDAAFDLGGGFDPAKGFGVFIPVGEDRRFQMADAVEAAAANGLASD